MIRCTGTIGLTPPYELELGTGANDPLLKGWAERIRPPPRELLDLVQLQLPDMLASDLLSLPYTPIYVPNYPAGRELAERDQLRRGEAPQVCGVSRGQRGQRNQGRLRRR